MKKVCKVVSLVGALALGTTIVSASEIAETIQGTVPFSFVVGSKVFPAGEYTFKETNSGVIVVQGAGTAALALTIPANMKPGSLPALRFTPSNGRTYLVGVEGANMSRELPLHVTETRTLAQ
jgi:hypothetical protein